MGDYLFWTGLIVGAVLSFGGSLLANLYTKKVESLLVGRRRAIDNKRREEEIREYRMIASMKADQTSALTFFIDSAAFMATSHILGGVFAAAFLIIMTIAPPSTVERAREGDRDAMFSLLAAVLCAVGLAAFFHLGRRAVKRYYRTRNRLGNFDDYEREVLAAFGPAARLPTAPSPSAPSAARS